MYVVLRFIIFHTTTTKHGFKKKYTHTKKKRVNVRTLILTPQRKKIQGGL